MTEDELLRISYDEYFNESKRAFVEVPAGSFIREVKRLTVRVRFWQPTRDSKYQLTEPNDGRPFNDGSFELEMFTLGLEHEQLPAISVKAKSLAPETAHKQRTLVIATCRHRQAYEAFLHLISEVKALYGPLWQEEQGVPHHPLRLEQEQPSLHKGTNSPNENQERDNEICRLRFDEHLTAKQITTEIQLQAKERRWVPVKQERVEQIYRGDDRQKHREK